MTAASRGEELLSLALAKEGDEGTVLNDLLAAFHRGLPIERLKVLLDHDDPDVVRAGAWVLSELGARGRALVSYLPSLLKHPLRWVRIYAVDSVLTCASTDDGSLAALTLELVDDVDGGVRWKAVDFLMRAPDSLLVAASQFLENHGGSTDSSQAIMTLLNGSTEDVHILLSSPVGFLRRVGIGAARRRGDRAALVNVKGSADEEMRTFAERALELMDSEERWAKRDASRVRGGRNSKHGRD